MPKAMPKAMPGLHHVTAISGPPQPNVDFYTGTLRQRLVKRTVNFDDPGTYHLYYGDRAGSPGTILTFFPFADAGPGRAGPGMADAVAYSVPQGTLDQWTGVLTETGTDFDGPLERFGERLITLKDPDGMVVELIEHVAPSGPSPANGTRETSDALPIGAFHSVTLWLNDLGPSARLLSEVFGYEEAGHDADGGTERLRLTSPGDLPGHIIDLKRLDNAPTGRQGAGSIHHVAFRAHTNEEHLEWRERVLAFGLDVTPVIDRQYFNAIYFREPGGVLYEIATDPPGFTVDEPVETMGQALKLPPQYESYRGRIEQVLPPLKVPA